MSQNTLASFGVPLGAGEGRGGMLMPKSKQKFRVRVFNFGPIVGGVDLTQQVHSVGRPHMEQNPVPVHSYNSIAYYAGKAEWSTISLVVRDDVTNSSAALVGHQMQKQMNFFQQTTTEAGANYKFQMYIETLDGGDSVMLEQWILEGCFLAGVEYGEFSYDSPDAMLITMTVRFDNATQQGGLMTLAPQVGTGPMLG